MKPPPQPLRALLVEDSEEDALLLVEALQRGGYEPDWKRVETEEDLRAALATGEWDVVFCDYALPQLDGPGALRILRESGDHFPALIISGRIGEEVAVEAMRLGANDFVFKHRLDRVAPTVERELRAAALRRERRIAEEETRVAQEALRASEARLRQSYDLQKALFDGLPAHIALVDAQGTILAVNAAWEQFAQANALATPDFCLGQNYITVCERSVGTDCEGAKEVASGLRRTLAGKVRGFTLEYPCHSPEEKRWFRASVAALADGSPRAVVMHINISERRAAEEVLSESERRFREMLETVELITMTLDGNGSVTFCNDCLLSTTGWTREKVIGADWFSKFTPDNPEVKKMFMETLVAGQMPPHHENPIRTKTGELRDIAWSNTMLRDTEGRIVGTASIGEDVTERKFATARIREQATLLDEARDAILAQDMTGQIRYWNKGAERLFGWTAAEAVGRNMHGLLHDDAECLAVRREAVLHTGEWTGEVSKLTKAGDTVLVASRWTLLRDDGGQPRTILVINTDITEKKKVEAQFFRAQRMESIGTLAGGIAHDLNNVLGPIIMAVDLLKMRLTDPRDLNLLELMETSGRRGADMVKQVLHFARGIEGRRGMISPVQFVKEIAGIVRDTFPKSIALKTDAPNTVWNLSADRTQIHQVLLNLCVNARDAMPRGGLLRISAKNREIDAHFAAMHPEARPGPYVTIEVADTGEGMSPEVLARIFEPFFTTKETGQGTGLGLSTTLAIVKSHGGFITVESSPGQGTTFHVNLPAEAGLAELPADSLPPDLPRGRGELILIIDDEASIRSITGQTLETFGYRVMSAGDGVGGVAKYAQHAAEIAIVLVDMMMPVMDGAATIRVLQRLNREVKIIATSGLSARGGEAEPAGTDVSFFLPKPYTAETLLRTLSQLLHPEE